MVDCIFCKIVDKKLPSDFVTESENAYCFLDIDPISSGHCLIIPKKHYENIFDIPDDVLKDVISLTKNVSIALKSSFDADGMSVAQNNGSSAGQEVFHLHFHVIPRFNNDGIKSPWNRKKGKYDEGEVDKVISLIRDNLPL